MIPNLQNWKARARPCIARAEGRFAAVEQAVFPRDASALFDVLCGPGNDDLWRYIPIGPFADVSSFSITMQDVVQKGGWEACCIFDVHSRRPLGIANYMRIREEAGSVEVGFIVFSKVLRQTPLATEAMYLMARHIFEDLGYRRYEWKCNNHNEASKRAAKRFGFVFEGVFRQDAVVKGENRDTAWFSILDSEWPKIKAAFEAWLEPENFDVDGQQRQRLEDMRAKF